MGPRAPRGGGQRAKRFGTLLASLRVRAMRSRSAYEQVVQRLRDRGIANISASTLHRYEKSGRVPDVLVVGALADLYRVDPNWLMASLMADLRGRSMPPEPDAGAPEAAELAPADESDEPPPFSSVRIIEGKIAAGSPLILHEFETAGHFAFEKRWLSRHGIARPVCVTVGPKEYSMSPTINPGEMVLLDCSDERRAEVKRDRIYAVNVDGGSTLKRLVLAPGEVHLVSDNPDKDRYPTRTIAMDEEDTAVNLIAGEVMWRGQPL